MVVYNHAAYVGEAISSVLRQTFTDFEFLILDNGSTDNSLSIIRSFSDSRIKVTVFSENLHSTCAANALLEKTSGQYIALLCSDDAWTPDKLERQVRYLEEHDECAVVFSRVAVIGVKGKRYRLPTLYDCHFNVHKNRGRDDWLRFLYRFENPFCCSSAMVRASALRRYGPYDARSCNVQDMILWMQILFQHDVYILEQKLTIMRYFPQWSNVSGAGPENMVLAANEARLFYAAFFANISSGDIFARVFPQAVGAGSTMPAEDVPFRLGLHVLSTPSCVMAKDLALDRLYDLMGTAEKRRHCAERYSFSILDLYAVARSADIYGHNHSLLRAICYAAAKRFLRQTGLLAPLKYYLLKRAVT